MRKQARVSHDLIWTSLTTVVLIVANLLLSYVLARRGAAAVFGPYNLAKRIAASALPIVTLELTIAMIRFSARARTQEERRLFQLSAVLTVLCLVSLLTVVVVCLPNLLSRVVLGTSDSKTVFAVWAYVVFTALAAMLNSLYRGDMRQGRANLSTLLTAAVIPLAVVLGLPKETHVRVLVSTTAAMGIAVVTALFLTDYRELAHVRHATRRMREALVHMLRYAVPRLPSGVAMGGLMSTVPLAATRVGAPLSASFVLAGISVANLGAASLSSLSVVLLPRIADLDSKGDAASVRLLSERAWVLIVVVSCAVVGVLCGGADVLIRIWLGAEFGPASLPITIAVLAVPGMMMYAAFSSVADAIFSFPVSTLTLLTGAFAGFGALALVPARSAVFLTLVIVVAQSIAGAMTVAVVQRHLGMRMHALYSLVQCGLALLVGFGLNLVSAHVGPGTSSRLLFVGVLAMAAASLLVFGLWTSPVETGLRESVASYLASRRAKW